MARTYKLKHNMKGKGINILATNTNDKPRFTPKTYNELKNMVDKYYDNDWKGKYGKIGTWDTHLITDMHELFLDMGTFNEDINNWDVSNVKNMAYVG